MVAVHDDFVLARNGRAAKAVDAGEDAGALEPEFFAAEIIGGDDDFPAVEKCAEDALAVARGRGGGVAVFAMDALRRRFDHGLTPEDFASGAVEAE